MAKKRGGRKKGSTNNDVRVVDTVATVCPTCGSEKRAAYWAKQRQTVSGTTQDGRIFTAIVRRRTKCLECGQHRVDREWVFARNTP